MNNPIVSVIMSVYNDEKYVSLAIDSILNQSYKDFEFIIINDGSTDKTLEILNDYERKDSRMGQAIGNRLQPWVLERLLFGARNGRVV